MNPFKYSFLISLAILVFNCKSPKVVTAGNSTLNLSTKQLITENAKQKANFTTLQSKLKIDFNQGDKVQTHTVSFRLKKDEIIWLSAPFSIAKALITPQKVSFYNKLDGTYFEGDYNYLSHILGTELDFNKFQNLLLGEAIFDLNINEAYETSIYNGAYSIKPKNQNNLFEILFLLDPNNFKLKSQKIVHPQEQKQLQVEYVSYQNIGKELLPEHIKIIALKTNKEVAIKLEFKGVILNENLSFPFSIPPGYKEIKF